MPARDGTSNSQVRYVSFVPETGHPGSKKSYECPAAHLRALEQCVTQVTKLLVVGWRAAESHFVGLLKDHLPHGVRVLVVAGNKESALETISRLQAGVINGEFIPSDHGFTEFIRRREVDDLLFLSG